MNLLLVCSLFFPFENPVKFADYYTADNCRINELLDEVKKLNGDKMFLKLPLADWQRYIENKQALLYVETEVQFLKEVKRRGFSSPEKYFAYLRLRNPHLKDRWLKAKK